MKITSYLHHPAGFARHSGMMPLVEAMGAEAILYRETWRGIQNRFWWPGYRLKWWGDSYYGSGWNALVPYVGEWWLAARSPAGSDVAHFVWAEFASPSRERWFRKKARRLVGTFHASNRKLPDVVRHNFSGLAVFDAITLMSETQKSFFVGRGFPPSRIRVILHGVDISYYQPVGARIHAPDGPIRGLLVGSTERDHAFMAQVMRGLPVGTVELTVLTNRQNREQYYRDVPGVRFPGHLSDEELRAAYQQADLLVMPLLDCTANNVILESMACGTPVMVNRVGGVSEYVDHGTSIVMESKNVEEWVATLQSLHDDRTGLMARRPGVRKWAERFDWNIKAKEYLAFFEEVARGPVLSP